MVVHDQKKEQIDMSDVIHDPVNLNTADLDELMTVSGVTRERALTIIDHRNANGPFKSWDEVRHLPGFSSDLVDLMRESVAFIG